LAPEAAGQHVAVVLVVVHDQDHIAALGLLIGARSGARRLLRALSSRRPATLAQELSEAFGGHPDAVQVAEQGDGAGLRRPPVQGLARRANARQRRAERAAGGPEIGWPRVAPGEHLVQQGQELARIAVERRESRGQVGLVAVLQLVQEQLGVADDVVQRRAQLVAQLRGGVDAHAPAARPSSASIFSSSRARSTGLVSKSSQPAAIAFSRSPDIACAVSAITGIARVSGAPLIWRVASHPSSPGRLMSIRISAGASEWAMATPCSPSSAIATSSPRRTRRRDSMSRFIS